MHKLESVFRKAIISFSVAALFTQSFKETLPMFFAISLITWVVAFGLFISSWKVKKELTHIFVRESNGQEDSSFWGRFERRFPTCSFIVWELFVTFAAIHLLYIALDSLNIIEVNGNRPFLFMMALAITVLFRVFDRHTYQKK